MIRRAIVIGLLAGLCVSVGVAWANKCSGEYYDIFLASVRVRDGTEDVVAAEEAMVITTATQELSGKLRPRFRG